MKMHRHRAFTLLELLITVAVVAVVLTLVVPSFTQFIVRQRLKSVNAQLVTDIQLARSEAVSRGTVGRVVFGTTASLTCYSIYTLKPGAAPVRCDCTQAPGSACDPDSAIEVRTVQVPISLGVQIVTAPGVDPAFGFDPVNGGLYTIPTDSRSQPAPPFQIDTEIDTSHLLRTVVGNAGRPTVCSLGDSYGPPAC